MNTITLYVVYLLTLVAWLCGASAVLAADMPCHFEPLSKQVYVINGSNPDQCPIKTLQHPVTNPVTIIGQSGVILVDPGSSQQVGKLVVDRLRFITSKPVIAIINTHIHGLYWLANHAVKTEFPEAKIYLITYKAPLAHVAS